MTAVVTDRSFNAVVLDGGSVLIPAGRRIGKPPFGELSRPTTVY